MQEPSALGRSVLLVRDLRRRCPWDGAQTPQTLRPYLVEEAFELDQALSEGDPERIRDELGDLLLHLAFQIVLGEEAGLFGADDVVSAMEHKMWRRHPHLFPAPQKTPSAPTPGPAAPHTEAARTGTGEAGASSKVDPGASAGGKAAVGSEGHGAGAGPGRVAAAGHAHGSWERTKAAERGPDGPGVLEGLPPHLPALIMAYRLQERTAGVGFDWPDASGPAAKVREELAELEAEVARGAQAESRRVDQELGDLLFAVVNLARKLGCDPRAALERANRRFVERFRTMERLAAAQGLQMGEASLEELDALWEAAKAPRQS